MSDEVRLPADRKLTALDRCDQCGAQAYVLTWISVAHGELLYCVHHWRRNEAKLKADALVWFDHSADLAKLVDE